MADWHTFDFAGGTVVAQLFVTPAGQAFGFQNPLSPLPLHDVLVQTAEFEFLPAATLPAPLPRRDGPFLLYFSDTTTSTLGLPFGVMPGRDRITASSNTYFAADVPLLKELTTRMVSAVYPDAITHRYTWASTNTSLSRSLIQPGDTVLSLEPKAWGSDLRLYAAHPVLLKEAFGKNADYGAAAVANSVPQSLAGMRVMMGPPAVSVWPDPTHIPTKISDWPAKAQRVVTFTCAPRQAHSLRSFDQPLLHSGAAGLFRPRTDSLVLSSNFSTVFASLWNDLPKEPLDPNTSHTSHVATVPLFEEAVENGALIRYQRKVPLLPDGTHAVVNSAGVPGDFDNGPGAMPDGAYINRADDGQGWDTSPLNTGDANSDWGVNVAGEIDFSALGYVAPTLHKNAALPPVFSAAPLALASSQFVPGRLAPSAVAFGSLPTGVWTGSPWQTLLFCPNPAAGATHPGKLSPPDFALLDLFTQPIVEPSALSAHFATAGRVNLNAQLAPFTNLHRRTALRALLKGMDMTVIPNAAGIDLNSPTGKAYKRAQTTGAWNGTFRRRINIDETLRQFDERFADVSRQHIFRSAGEVCELFLVPQESGVTLDTVAGSARNGGSYWQDKGLTGDNTREWPYATLYPRVTTKSNTYTVHVWAQTLQPRPGSDPTRFDTTRGPVTGEWRGSFLIERAIDLTDPRLPDAAGGSRPRSLEDYYQWRVLATTPFQP